jgi:opacity protein-like surface antigen
MLVVVALFAAALPAHAQDSGRGDFSAGWRVLRAMDAGVDGESEVFPLGWYADAAVNLDDAFAIVGDVAGAYKSIDGTESALGVTVSSKADITLHTFMGGVRYTSRRDPRIVPFAQVLFGVARGSLDLEQSVTVGGRTTSLNESESSNEFAFDIGGGVTLPATDRIDVRFGASYLRIGADDGGNGFRLGVGVVFPF